MPIRKYVIDPPFISQAGDSFIRAGNAWQQWRAGVLIDTRTDPASAVLSGPELFGGNQVEAIYEEQRMPGINISLNDVTENPSTGSVSFNFSNGSRELAGGWQDASLLADQIDADEARLQDFIIARSYRQSPDGANKTTQVGCSVSVNLQADVPLVYTEPV